jgi:hypothetical protein
MSEITGAMIEVTADDISQGERHNCTDCPIARAVVRTLGHSCVIDGVTVEIDCREYYLPKEARAFVARFDDGKPVKPFSCVIGDEWRYCNDRN